MKLKILLFLLIFLNFWGLKIIDRTRHSVVGQLNKEASRHEAGRSQLLETIDAMEKFDVVNYVIYFNLLIICIWMIQIWLKEQRI